MGRFVAAVLAVCFAALPVPARADDLISRAEKLAKQNKFEEALGLFKQAAAADPTNETYCLIALVYRRMQRWSESAHFLSLAKSAPVRDKEPPYCTDSRNVVQQYLTSGNFAPVALSVDPPTADVSVSDFAADERVASGETIWLPYGRHVFTASAGSYQSASVPVEISSHDPLPLHITLVSEPVPVPIPVPVPDPAPASPLPVEPPPSGRGAAPWLVLGTGAAALGVGVAFHVLAAQTRSDASKLPPGPAFDDKLSTFDTQRTICLVGYGVGAVAVGIGIYLLVRPRHPHHAVTVAAAPLPGGGFAALGWELP